MRKVKLTPLQNKCLVRARKLPAHRVLKLLRLTKQTETYASDKRKAHRRCIYTKTEAGNDPQAHRHYGIDRGREYAPGHMGCRRGSEKRRLGDWW